MFLDVTIRSTATNTAIGTVFQDLTMQQARATFYTQLVESPIAPPYLDLCVHEPVGTVSGSKQKIEVYEVGKHTGNIEYEDSTANHHWTDLKIDSDSFGAVVIPITLAKPSKVVFVKISSPGEWHDSIPASV